MVHVYCGDGKGKTTAAVGLAVRALSNGYFVVFVQFLKSGRTGEVETLKTLNNVEIIRAEGPIKFTFQMNEKEREECLGLDNELLKRALSVFLAHEKSMLILDESMGALSEGLLDFDELKEAVERWGHATNREIVLTGRDPSKEIVNLADYVSRIDKIKHPYDFGVNAREGIEF